MTVVTEIESAIPETLAEVETIWNSKGDRVPPSVFTVEISKPWRKTLCLIWAPWLKTFLNGNRTSIDLPFSQPDNGPESIW